MLKSIALIMLIGMSTGWVCRKVKLPGLLGMLFTGIILGPLIFRMAGVALCMAGTKLKLKERVFCMLDRKSTRLNSSHRSQSRMPSSA